MTVQSDLIKYSRNSVSNLTLSGGLYVGGTGAANYLDDYEEGTWTPTLSGSGGDPTGVSYLVQEGSYVKVGSRVFLNAYMGFTTYSGGSGNIQIKGIPFAIPSNNNRWSVGACTPELISFGGGYTYMVMRARSGTSVLEPIQAGSNTYWGGVSLGSAPSGATNKYFIFTVEYTTT